MFSLLQNILKMAVQKEVVEVTSVFFRYPTEVRICLNLIYEMSGSLRFRFQLSILLCPGNLTIQVLLDDGPDIHSRPYLWGSLGWIPSRELEVFRFFLNHSATKCFLEGIAS